jgi:hypothetical protein
MSAQFEKNISRIKVVLLFVEQRNKRFYKISERRGLLVLLVTGPLIAKGIQLE